MVTGRVFVAWEQKWPRSRDQHLALKGFYGQMGQGNLSNTIRRLGVGYPYSGIRAFYEDYQMVALTLGGAKELKISAVRAKHILAFGDACGLVSFP